MPGNAFERTMTEVGSYEMHVFHINTQEEVVGSPAAFAVTAGEPHAGESTFK
jgi:hypothetical protein